MLDSALTRNVSAAGSVDDFIHAFEQAWQRDENVDLERFLPAAGHPLYATVLRELVRVDLEFSWHRGKPRALEEYLQRFPALAHDPQGLQDSAYEEYRQRQQAGELVDPSDYESRFGVITLEWPRPGGELEFVVSGGSNPSRARLLIPEGTTQQPEVTQAPVLAARPVGDVTALLRRNLRLISLGAVIMLTYFAGLVLLNPDRKVGLFLEPGPLTSVNGTLLLVCLVLATVLWFRRSLSILQLRHIELALVGVLLTEIGLGFFADLFWDHELREPLAAGDHALFHYASSWSLPFFALIVGYGTLVPSTGRRCATVVTAIAIVPLAIAVAAGVREGVIERNDYLLSFLLQMTLWMAAGAGIAAYGAHRLDILRQEASHARQLGQYRLVRPLGSGGMGEVFLAEHVLLRRPCAVKVIHPKMAGDQETLRRFEDEARVTAGLTHPNTVQIFDYGTSEDGTFYCAMEYLPGWNLEQLVMREGPVEPGRALDLLRQVCGALSEAHRVGLIHRDIKPSNIIVCERGGVRDVAKLLDFGLVQGAGKGDPQPGTFGGTPSYASPEQAQGRGLVDARSDIYSLGAVAYFLLTGKPPFVRPSMLETLAAHAKDPVPPPRQLQPALSPALERVVLQCLEKDPSRRFQTVDALEAALERCKSHQAATESSS
jgi:serine/threonine-protein kinase